tara:strand:- start:49 stop:456 length:408 start_codon:yes stop_codon:yes gene_type:complete
MGIQTIKLGKELKGESNFKIESIKPKVDKEININERPLTKFKYRFLKVEYSSSGKLFIFFLENLHRNIHIGKHTIIAAINGAIFWVCVSPIIPERSKNQPIILDNPKAKIFNVTNETTYINNLFGRFTLVPHTNQ